MQRIARFCDRDWVKDQTEVPGVTKEFNLGQGPKEIEICEKCESSMTLKDLSDLLEDVGRAVVQRKAKKVGEYTGKPKNRVGEFPCRFCSDVRNTSQGRGMHEFRDHPWQRLLWEEKNEYVKVNKLGFDDRERRRKWLEQLDRLGLTLEEAADREIKLGAPPNTWSPDREGIADRLKMIS